MTEKMKEWALYPAVYRANNHDDKLRRKTYQMTENIVYLVCFFLCEMQSVVIFVILF